MGIKYIDGNILNSRADIILHQVNCQGVMGAGLAKQIKAWCPQHYQDYIKCCKNTPPKELLGHWVGTRYSSVNSVIGIFGQLNYGRDKCYTDYNALRTALLDNKRVINDLYWQYPNCRIAIPYGVGCGLAGGQWNIVLEILNELFEYTENDKSKITLEIWKFNGDTVLRSSEDIMKEDYGSAYDLMFKK